MPVSGLLDEAVEHGQAKLEGLLEGLREAIAGCNVARSAQVAC